MPTPPVILSIAGYDPSSGAGITADIKTAAALDCYAATCLTAVTVQSTQGVYRVRALEPELISETLAALADDLDIAAIRIGMLGSGEVAAAVAGFLEERAPRNVVLDPVIRSSSGTALLDAAGLDVLRRRMIARSEVITPNVAEAAILAGMEPYGEGSAWESAAPQLPALASHLHDMGARAVVITGGHVNPPNDFLVQWRNGKLTEEIVPGKHIESRSTHGTGCAFATALACRLALGDDLSSAVRTAKDYVRRAILSAYPLGKGVGPLNHFG